MAEETYVKLPKGEVALQDVTPGELNRPIDIKHEDNLKRCEHCGQVLRENFEGPADEDWTTGIFGCLEDKDSCLTGFFCPCVLFGRNISSYHEQVSPKCACVGHGILVEGGITATAIVAVLACNGIVDPNTLIAIGQGLFTVWWLGAAYAGVDRQLNLQRKYHMKDSPCDPMMVHFCLHWCAICQEHREMKNHLPEGTTSESTVVKPPPVQQMNAARVHDQPSSSSAHEQTDNNNRQLTHI